MMTYYITLLDFLIRIDNHIVKILFLIYKDKLFIQI